MKAEHEMESVQLLTGDARTILAGLPTGSVDCVVSSPPYWRKRDYGVAGQFGLGDTIEAARRFPKPPEANLRPRAQGLDRPYRVEPQCLAPWAAGQPDGPSRTDVWWSKTRYLGRGHRPGRPSLTAVSRVGPAREERRDSVGPPHRRNHPPAHSPEASRPDRAPNTMGDRDALNWSCCGCLPGKGSHAAFTAQGRAQRWGRGG